MARICRCLYTAYHCPGHRGPAHRGAAAWRVRLVGGLATVVLAATLAAPATAQQQYRVDQPNPSAKSKVAAATLCVRNPAEFATRKADFDEYFQKYYFPAMTLYGADDLEELGDLRYDLFSRYLWKSQSPQVQQQLTNLAYQAMGKILVADNPPYHPAVRYNAVLTLGMLDEQYATGNQPPEPLAKATDVLTKIVGLGISNGRFPPTIIVGALVGLERHAQYHASLPPEAIQAMATVALKLIDQNQPIQDVDPDIQAWIQLRAAGILANLGTVGQGNRNLTGLLKLVASDKSLDDRCYVANLLSKIDFQGATVDGKAAAEPLVQLALAVSQDEAERAKEYRKTLAGGGGIRYGGRYGENEEFQRRGMLARLTELKAGLQAIAPIAPEATQAQLTTIVAAIDPVIDAAADDKTIDLDLTAKILQMARTIKDVASAATAPATSDVSAAAG